MYINKNKIINSILCGCNAKFPISNSHYICGKDILAFSNIICIENTLTNITSQLKSTCQNITNYGHNNFIKKW